MVLPPVVLDLEFVVELNVSATEDVAMTAFESKDVAVNITLVGVEEDLVATANENGSSAAVCTAYLAGSLEAGGTRREIIRKLAH